MFKNYLSLLSLLSLACLLTQCKKEKVPSADFVGDKTEYVEGETAVFTQKSSNADTYRWTMPDGTTQKGETASFPLPIHGTDRVVQIKLEAISQSGDKSDVAVKNFPVKAAGGNVMMWAYNGIYQLGFPFTTTVTVDNSEVFVGQILNLPEPACGPQPGCAFFPVKVGTHIIQVLPENLTYTVQMTKDACVKVKR